MTKDPSEPVKDTTTHEAWFLRLSPKEYLELCKAWNSQQIGVTLPKDSDTWEYDEYFAWFKKQPSNAIKKLQVTGGDMLNTEAMAALRVWADILANPHRINKIHASSLSNKTKEDEKSLLDKAREGDTLGVLSTQLERLIIESEKASPKDLPNYTRAISEMMEQINDLKRRQAPSTSTFLGRMLDDNIKKRRPSYQGGGTDKQKFKSRVLIEDVEKA